MVARLLQTGMVIPDLYVVFLSMMFLSGNGILSRVLSFTGLITDFHSFQARVFHRRGRGSILSYALKVYAFHRFIYDQYDDGNQ